MLKRIILIGGFLLTFLTSSFCGAEENERWVPLYNEANNVYCYLDRNTVQYDRETGDLVYWLRTIPKSDVVVLKRYLVNLNEKSWQETYTVINGPGEKHKEGSFAPVGHITISPGSRWEQEVNAACDVLNLQPVLVVKKHEWKFIKDLKDDKYYMCGDVYAYDKEHKTVTVYLRTVFSPDKNLGKLEHEAIVDLPGHRIYYPMMGSRFVAPDTLEEAIYNLTVDLVKYKND